MKPKVGEVWLVDSGYTWGWCIVEVVSEETADEPTIGHVINGENDDSFMDDQWYFGKGSFVKRLEK